MLKPFMPVPSPLMGMSWGGVPKLNTRPLAINTINPFTSPHWNLPSRIANISPPIPTPARIHS